MPGDLLDQLTHGSESDLTDFTLSNARRFYLSAGGPPRHLGCQWVTQFYANVLVQ